MHHVRLALTHAELTAQYGLRHGMALEIRAPYDIKAQRVRYTTVTGDPFTPPYGDIHHRTETLRGISDPSIGIDYAPRPDWLFGIGTTLPAGHIVPDPIVLGREGKTHEHLQFGSGTFQPKLLAQWANSRFVAAAEAQLSLYGNREGYRAPTTILWSAGPTFRAGRLGIDPRLIGQFQSLGRWSGVVDEGSGYRAAGVRLQLSRQIGTFLVAPAVTRELRARGTDVEATARVHQATTWSLSLSRTF